MALLNKIGSKAVGASDTSVVVTFATDEASRNPSAFNGGLTLIPSIDVSWATSFYISAISATAMTVQFGTQPGGYGGTLYWKITGYSL